MRFLIGNKRSISKEKSTHDIFNEHKKAKPNKGQKTLLYQKKRVHMTYSTGTKRQSQIRD